MNALITRRKLTTLDKLIILIRQAGCPCCGKKLGHLDDTEFDHVHPLALGGSDTLDNIQAIHAEPCHKAKTSGTAATTAGSDIHRIAKVKRLAPEHEEFRRKVLSRECGERRKPKGKIRSRGFPKGQKRGFGK